MGNEIIRSQTPEEQELEKKKAEIAALEAELIQCELDLAILRAELTEFESLYLRTVGILYAELDDIEAQIAEAEARRRPRDSNAQEQASRARAQARESFESAHIAAEPRLKSTDTLKKLYREVAKRIHPDLADNDTERARRQKLMAEANVAYENGHEDKLRKILADWETSPETVEGEGIGAELIRLIRKIAQIQKRLAEIDSEIHQLSASDLSQLRNKVEEANSQERSLLEEMASQVQSEIENAKRRLATVVNNRADI